MEGNLGALMARISIFYMWEGVNGCGQGMDSGR